MFVNKHTEKTEYVKEYSIFGKIRGLRQIFREFLGLRMKFF